MLFLKLAVIVGIVDRYVAASQGDLRLEKGDLVGRVLGHLDLRDCVGTR